MNGCGRCKIDFFKNVLVRASIGELTSNQLKVHLRKYSGNIERCFSWTCGHMQETLNVVFSGPVDTCKTYLTLFCRVLWKHARHI